MDGNSLIVRGWSYRNRHRPQFKKSAKNGLSAKIFLPTNSDAAKLDHPLTTLPATTESHDEKFFSTISQG